MDQPINKTQFMSRTAVRHEARFSFMGQHLLFQTNHPKLLDAATQAFSKYPPAPPTSPPLQIQLFVDEKQTTSCIRPYPAPIFHSHQHLLYLNVGAESSVVIDLSAGYTFGHIHPDMAVDISFVRYTFIEMAAQAMLGLARDYVPLHAACVVKNNLSLLLHGQAGVGKSTLTYACLCQGFQMVAEDIVQVHITEDGLHMWGMPWQLHLLPDAVRFFPELQNKQQRKQVNGEIKIEVDVSQQFPEAPQVYTPGGVLLFLGRDDKRKGMIERMTAVAARQQFEVVWAWEVGWKPLYDRQLNQLLAADAYRFWLADTPQASAACLADFCEQYQP